MSQENVETVRRFYDGVNARLELPREPFDPDWELDVTEIAVDFGVVRGYEASQEALRTYWETFEDFRYEIEEVIHTDGKRVVTAVRDGGRMSGSDSEVWSHFFHVWTFRGGKVVRTSAHTDKNRALEAAGLRE